MKKLFFIFYLFSTSVLFSQEVLKPTFIDSFEIKADNFIGRDIYNNFYFIKNNTLIKKQNHTFTEYQNIALGKLEHIDLSNPLLLVLFYKDFNTIVILDHQMNETQKISGNDFGLVFDVVGLARQNNLWFFDSVSQKFGLYNLKENTFKFISTYFPTKFKQWNSTYNDFEWIDNNDDFLSINFFGKITNLKKVDDFEKIKIVNQNDFLAKQGESIYFITTKKKYEIKTEQKSFKNFCFKDGILSIFTTDKVFNYKINLP